MRYVLGVISLIVGIFLNFLVFTQAGSRIVINYSMSMVYMMILSVMCLGLSVYNLIKNKEIVLSIISIIGIMLNVVFLGYCIILISFAL